MKKQDLINRLQDMGLTLPKPVAPIATYVPWLLSGDQVYISGQVSLTAEGTLLTGAVGTDQVSIEDGQFAARHCAVNLLAQLCQALNDEIERLEHCVRLNGFVNCGAGFTDHPKVINGASDLMVQVLGDKGKHTRIAVGASSLPLNASVEIDAIFKVRS